MSQDYQEELELAVEAATQAAATAAYIATDESKLGTQSKGFHDIVTKADLAAEKVIVELIQSRFPKDAILAEEGGRQAARESDRLWIIDPIDGTTNFSRGLSPCGVSIGLKAGDDLVVGVVKEIFGGDLFAARRGGGLFVNGKRATVSDRTDLGKSIITTGFPFKSFEHIDAYIEVMKVFMTDALALRRPGSAAVDMAWLACGRFDGFFEYGLSPWDVAAGTVLIREGGGTVTDFELGEDFLFGHQIIASNGGLHEAMASAVEPLKNAAREA